jgi:chromosomal replication initiator protein
MEVLAENARAKNATGPAIYAAIQDRIGAQKFNAWFRRGTQLAVEDAHVLLTVPNLFVAHWIETHYQADIARAAEEQTGRPRKVLVTVDPALTGQVPQGQLDTQAQIVRKAAEGLARPLPGSAPHATARPGDATPTGRPTPLRYRLEDFVVGQSNKLAYSAALAVAGGGACPFGHLFIHGPCGVGKTHLLQGICNAASHRHGRDGGPLQWRFVTGEQFTNEFVTAVRKGQGGSFRARYRGLDLLAVDDVHFLSAKKATQDELLHTFNAIQSAGKRVVLASDAHPRLVNQFNEQLVSRFLAGMVVKIDSPDEPLRREVLRRRAAELKLRVEPGVLEYLASHIRGSVRELEGAALKLAAVSALHEGPVTVAMVNDALADTLARTDSAITLSDIEAAVGAFFGLTPADLHSSRRTRTISLARRLVALFARRYTRMSYPEIGRALGKNHSSIVLAVQHMERSLREEGEFTWLTPAGDKSMRASKVVELLAEQFA